MPASKKKRVGLRPDQLVQRYTLVLTDLPHLGPAIDAIYARSKDNEVRLEALQALAHRNGRQLTV